MKNNKNKPWGHHITKVVLKSKVADPFKYVDSLGIKSVIVGEQGNKWRLYAWHFKTNATDLVANEGFKFQSTGQMP